MTDRDQALDPSLDSYVPILFHCPMGARNPDRIPISQRRSKCETVADMRRAGWDVVSKCDVCGLIMQVDLALIIRVKGVGVSLWNRKARCRRLHCHGWVAFQARAPGMGWHEPLEAEWPCSRS